MLQGFSSLRYLRLGRNRLVDRGMDPAAFNLSSLVELDLSYNQLTQIPVVPTTLQYLYLEANQIAGEGLASVTHTVQPATFRFGNGSSLKTYISGNMTYSRLYTLPKRPKSRLYNISSSVKHQEGD